MSSLKKYNLKPVQARFVKFGLLGGLTTVFGLALYFILLKTIGLSLYVAYPIVFTLSVLLSYFLNTWLNYRLPPNLKGLISFYQSYIISGIIGFLILIMLKFLLPDWDEFVLAILLVGIRVLITFFLIEKLMFKNKTQTNDSE